jgi:hypothetical protein
MEIKSKLLTGKVHSMPIVISSGNLSHWVIYGDHPPIVKADAIPHNLARILINMIEIE